MRFSRLRSPFNVLFLFIAIELSLSAAAKPDFTGTWKLNSQASDFGPLPAPSLILDKISRETGAFVVDRVRDRVNFTLRIPWDGSSVLNKMREVDMKTQARWDSDILVVTYEGIQMASPVTIEERWTLSSDRNAWTIAKHLSSSRGIADQTIVMQRQ